MSELFDLPFISLEFVLNSARVLLFLTVGYLIARFASRTLGRLLSKRTDVHRGTLVRRVVFYLILLVFLISAMRQMGFDLGVLLGAAGLMTVAIGFAAQTSMSNFISGLFLIGEAPFALGDVIKVGDVTGEVIAIDLLSVKLRTYDNLFVRIPNEKLIKSDVTTLTKFPIRRADLKLGVAYKEDIGQVKKLLLEAADKNTLCLDEPAPVFILLGFGESSMDIQFSVWVKRENFLELKNSIQQEIKAAFDANGIEIPFPHRTLYTGSQTEPMPVRLVGDTQPHSPAAPAQERGPETQPPSAPPER